MIFLVLEDFVAGSVSASAGSLLDSTSINIAQLQSAGLAAVLYNPATMEASRLAFLAARGSRPAVPDNSGDLTALLLAAGAIGGSGGGVTSVTASAPLASSGGATPDISLSAGSSAGDVLTWNGASWTGSAPAVTGITELGGDVIAGPGTGLQNAIVAGIEGIPVDATPPTPGQVLGYDGTWWTPTTLPADTGITELTGDVLAGPGSGSQAATVSALQGNPVSSVLPSDGQVLTWNGSAWVPGAPASGGSGGGGQIYFFNNGTSGDAPLPVAGTKELGLVAETPLSSVTSAILPSDGTTFALVAGFVTDLGAPGLTTIPAGLWDCNVWASASGPSATENVVRFRLRIYTWDGATSTLLATSSTAPLYDPSQPIQYIASALLPQTTILATDRIYIAIEATATANNHTITLDFGDARPSHLHTTLPSIAGTGLVHVINGVVQSPASPVDLTAGATEISGTLPVGNGGTGLATAPSNGQLLIGNGTGYAQATLTAGSGVSITNGAGSITIDATGGGGAVFAGSLTVYVDPTNGLDAPGGGTLGAPYRTINYAYSQVPSLGNPTNTVYNAQVGQFVTEKLVFQLAPGRYSENVVLGFRRGRVQLVGNGVQILGSVTMRALRADFPAANMESIKASFPAPYTGAGTLATFEITGSSGGGVEADTTADPFVVTGLSMLLFDEPTVPGTISSGTAWENNYGQFNFYANKAYLVGGMVYSTSYVSTPTRGLCTSVLEVDSCTIGESAISSRSYFGAVPYAYAANPTLWNKGTGVATGAQSSTTLQDTTKAWTVNEYAGATVVITAGTGASQTRTVLSNTATALTVSAAWGTTPVAASSVYSLVGVANKVAEGTLTAKVHNTTLGASVGPRVTLGELDGCRVYDLDQTMLGTVDNGGVTGSISSSYLGSVVNQFRTYSGTGIPASQYQLGSALSGTRYKIDSTSYTTLAFSRSSTTGVLTARTLNVPTASGTATAGGATTLTDSAAAWTTNRWAGGTLTLTGGTGSGQSRTISSNTATAITVSPAWGTNPAAGTTYTVTALVAFDFQDEARSLAYTPTTGANWLDPDPVTVQSALDKVAATGLLAAAPSNGQIPIGNGTSFTPATLTAGANIAIANGAGSVSVAVSASPNGTFHVAQGGSDVTGTGSILAPFASISAALAVAGAGTVVSVGPGTFTEAAPLAIPLDRSVVGSPETTIVAPAGVTMSEGTALENVSLTTPTIATTGTRPAGPGATVNLTRVFVTSATTVNNNGTNTAFVTTNTTFGGATTINGGPTNSVVYDYSRASSSTTINNTTSFSATASSFLSISSTNSTTALSNTSVTGNVAVSGGSLSATSSTIGGSLNASAAAAVNLSLDSQPQGGSTLAGGATLTSLTIVASNVALDGTATLSTPATIGSVYVPQARTLTAGSLGFFGGSLITDTSSLTLVPSGGGPAAATWTRTGLLGSQALTSGGSLVAGWYDIVLTPGASGTAFARGLYLV